MCTSARISSFSTIILYNTSLDFFLGFLDLHGQCCQCLSINFTDNRRCYCILAILKFNASFDQGRSFTGKFTNGQDCLRRTLCRMRLPFRSKPCNRLSIQLVCFMLQVQTFDERTNITRIPNGHIDLGMAQVDPVGKLLWITAGRFHDDMQLPSGDDAADPLKKFWKSLRSPFENATRQRCNLCFPVFWDLIQWCRKCFFPNIKSGPNNFFSLPYLLSSMSGCNLVSAQ